MQSARFCAKNGVFWAFFRDRKNSIFCLQAADIASLTGFLPIENDVRENAKKRIFVVARRNIFFGMNAL
jgi:hypothetical protein